MEARTLIYHNVEQGSDFWFELRKGIPTASNFGRILTPKTMKVSASGIKYAQELVGERLCKIPPEGVESATTRAMKWGTLCEQQARAFYCMDVGQDVFNGGFCLSDDGRFGASPDALIGLKLPGEHSDFASTEGCLELKCPQAGTQIEYLCAGVLPDDYKCQVHGQLIVTGAKWVDFLSYCPGLPEFKIRVEPDAFTDALRKALDTWYRDFEALCERFGAK
jgi:hypothetical protein